MNVEQDTEVGPSDALDDPFGIATPLATGRFDLAAVVFIEDRVIE